ncbi:hypothetical protein [Stappia indica]|uniref:Uncharacterized protein n=1 Tax=Stappia indica TaxID=538381 RepID=A0A857C4N4_9HYPH|nr:hypothetical protein [Stappia indica]QGZ33950.1 hypothetical protein GH266_05140 [Stappia indica]
MIADAHAAMEAARDIVEGVRDEEETARDNLPESLQEGNRGMAIQDAIDALEAALGEFDTFDFSELTDQLERAARG